MIDRLIISLTIAILVFYINFIFNIYLLPDGLGIVLIICYLFLSKMLMLLSQ